jgi:hypothetical protein
LLWFIQHNMFPPLCDHHRVYNKVYSVRTALTSCTGTRTCTLRRSYLMLPPHIAERTRQRFDHEWFTEHSWANVTVHTSRSVFGSLVFPRFGTRASFDAEQKNRHQTHRRSYSARMPNVPRARSRGECSAMCGGSMKPSVLTPSSSCSNFYRNIYYTPTPLWLAVSRPSRYCCQRDYQAM